MQENEFEKQVKQKMDEFRLHPSDPVWLGVRQELRKKRRRRLLFIPLFAVLLTAGYFSRPLFLTSHSNSISSTEKEISVKNKTNDKKTSENHDNKLRKDTSEKINTQPAIKQLSSGNKKESVAQKKNNSGGSHQGGSSDRKEKNYQVNNKIITNNNNTTIDKPGKSKELSNEAERDIETAIKKNKKDLTELNNYDLNVKNTGAGQPKKNVETGTDNNKTAQRMVYPVTDPVSINDRLPPINLLADSITDGRIMGIQLPSAKSLNTLEKSSKLKLGFVFSTGVSTRKEKAFQLSSALEQEKSVNQSAYATPSFANAGQGVLILQPSEVKAGFAFKAGVMAMKPISRRFDISTGIQYSFSSDHIEIGNSINTYVTQGNALFDIRASASNASTKKINYTNKYQFIELPVSVYFKVTPKWKTPFVWNAGASVSRLISSNVLLYDASLGGVYYRGDKDLNKTQLILSTGFAFRFAGNSRLQWNVGPELYMNSTKLFQSAYDKNNHPVYGGLNVQVLFPAGKKKHR